LIKGKTCLVQATAMESSAKLFSIRPSEVLSKYQGESERYISQLFENAQQLEKAIIFFDGPSFISSIF
jgi:vacuolar protein-sorting-associated protein 4